jgi:4-hydroxy-tetrahydrodipicolinate synthase
VRLSDALLWGLIPAVPVPFRGENPAAQAQRAYAAWMARQPIAGVAVWAHTGRGPHLSAEQRRDVITTWREALPGRILVAGATSVSMARDARGYGAHALLAFPTRDNPPAHHAALGMELPVIAFDLFEAAGGVAYDDDTLREILGLPAVIGVKVATLDSVVRFQRIAALLREFPSKLLITGEDRFLGYSLIMGARAALIGMGAVATGVQARLIRAMRDGDWGRVVELTGRLDEFGAVLFDTPVEGYIRRTLWALAAQGVIPPDACDDPWGPMLSEPERIRVVAAIRALEAAA